MEFAGALYDVPGALVENAGDDRLDTLADIRAALADGVEDSGYVLPQGRVGSAIAFGVLDPVAVKHRMITSVSEVADLLHRIDDAIDASFTNELAGQGESIDDEEAEKHMDYLERTEGTRWDT